jgi:metallo-beta-lactamase family protein
VELCETLCFNKTLPIRNLAKQHHVHKTTAKIKMTKTNSAPSVRVSVHGAAGTVTGSKYLIEADQTKILVDCGLFQGKKELRLRNWEEPTFALDQLSAIVLTHAHIDHTGYLPLVVKRGYRGPIYCTPATGELLELLLPDTAHLQEEEALYANKKGTSKHSPATPLYSQADAAQTLRQVRVIEARRPTPLRPQITVRPTCAGHILGSVALTFDVYGKRISFSGDVGRYNMPILPDPEPLELGDLLFCESTYGDRLHETGDIRTELIRVIRQTAQRGGTLLIPAFAVGRTQSLLYYLSELEQEGQIPSLPVFVDSPMAVDATRIYRAHREEYDEEAAKLFDAGQSVFSTQSTIYCRSVDQSKQLNNQRGARIIIAASGMATGGRILHHLMNLLPKEDTTVLFVGFQAEETRGRLIQSGIKEIKIFGSLVRVRANIETISGLSAHADQGELMRWLQSTNGRPQQVKVVHGEGEAISAFVKMLKNKFNWNASPANHLETIEVP